MAPLPFDRRPIINFALLYRPFAPRALVLSSIGIVLGTALYCLTYNWAQGTQESLVEAVGWSSAKIVPWLFALEIGERVLDDPAQGPARIAIQFAAIIAGTLVASVMLEWIIAG